MKKILDKIKSNIQANKSMLIFLIIIGIIGIIIGSILNVALNETDRNLVSEYLNNFIVDVKSNNLNYNASLINCLLSNCGYIIFIWLLGISIIGIPIILFLLFCKTFVLGFSISSIIANFKLKGCLLSLAYVFPHMVINLIIILFLTIYSLSLSLKLFMVIIKKQNLDFKNIMNKYLKILIICIITTIITALIEVYISPILIKFVIGFL